MKALVFLFRLSAAKHVILPELGHRAMDKSTTKEGGRLLSGALLAIKELTPQNLMLIFPKLQRKKFFVY